MKQGIPSGPVAKLANAEGLSSSVRKDMSVRSRPGLLDYNQVTEESHMETPSYKARVLRSIQHIPAGTTEDLAVFTFGVSTSNYDAQVLRHSNELFDGEFFTIGEGSRRELTDKGMEFLRIIFPQEYATPLPAKPVPVPAGHPLVPTKVNKGLSAPAQAEKPNRSVRRGLSRGRGANNEAIAAEVVRLHKEGNNCIQICEKMRPNAPSYETVCRWVANYKKGRPILSNRPSQDAWFAEHPDRKAVAATPVAPTKQATSLLEYARPGIEAAIATHKKEIERLEALLRG